MQLAVPAHTKIQLVLAKLLGKVFGKMQAVGDKFNIMFAEKVT